jgi:hypothetical protein
MMGGEKKSDGRQAGAIVDAKEVYIDEACWTRIRHGCIVVM